MARHTLIKKYKEAKQAWLKKLWFDNIDDEDLAREAMRLQNEIDKKKHKELVKSD